MTAQQTSQDLLRLYAEAKRREALMPNEPEYLDGQPPIIRFSKSFRGSYQVYQYSAIGIGKDRHFGHGELLWNTTGPISPKGQSWQSLMDWLGERQWDTVEVLYGLVEEKPELPVIEVDVTHVTPRNRRSRSTAQSSAEDEVSYAGNDEDYFAAGGDAADFYGH